MILIIQEFQTDHCGSEERLPYRGIKMVLCIIILLLYPMSSLHSLGGKDHKTDQPKCGGLRSTLSGRTPSSRE